MLQLYNQVTFYFGSNTCYDNYCRWTDDKIEGMSVHATTHIYGDGVVIDVTPKKDFDEITVNNIQLDMRG